MGMTHASLPLFFQALAANPASVLPNFGSKRKLSTIPRIAVIIVILKKNPASWKL